MDSRADNLDIRVVDIPSEDSEVEAQADTPQLDPSCEHFQNSRVGLVAKLVADMLGNWQNLYLNSSRSSKDHSAMDGMDGIDAMDGI